MRYLSLFSGIEAATAAWHPLGWECVAVAEIEPFPSKVLAHHYPNVRNLGDVTKLTELDIADLGPIDVVVFGSPCQGLSLAGKRKGLADARSGLFFTAMQIITWSRLWCGTRFALWENVPGAFSSNQGADFAAVVDELSGLAGTEPPPKGWGTEGCAAGPEAMVEWSTLDAQWFGVAQRRRRVFALADFGNWSGRQPILLEPQGLRGDSAPSREAGQGFTHSLAPSLTASGRGVERTGDTRGQDPVVAHSLRGEGFEASEGGTGRGTPLVPVGVTIHGTDPTVQKVASYSELAQCLRARTPGNIDNSSTTVVQHPVSVFCGNYNGSITGDVAATLGTQSGDGVSSGPSVMVPVHCRDIAGAITSNGGGHRAVAVAFTGEEHGRMDGGTPQGSNDLPTGAVRGVRLCECGGSPQERGLEGSPTGEPATPVQKLSHEGASVGQEMHAVRQPAQGAGLLRDALPAFQEVGRPDSGQGLRSEPAEVVPSAGLHGEIPREGLLQQACPTGAPGDAGSLADDQIRGSLGSMAVRRLLPEECERLMGFPDNFTQIPWRNKPADQCPDGPRYKSLGNSMAVPVMNWIGRRIDLALLFQE